MEKIQYKIHDRGAKRQPSKFKENKKKRNLIAVFLSVVSIALWIFVLYSLSHFSALTVRSVKVEGSSEDISGEVTRVAEEAMTGDYFNLFSKSSIFLYPKRTIIDRLSDISARAESISIERDGWDTIVVHITEKKPAATVCLNLPDWSGDGGDGDECYYADRGGKIFMVAPSENIFNRYYIPGLHDGSTSSPIFEMAATTTSVFLDLQNFYDGLRSAGLVAKGMLVKGAGEYELFVDNPTSQPSSTTEDTVIIYFNEKNNLQNELENLVSFWAYQIRGAETKKEPILFDSIDLRYGSNVFYRQSK